MSKGRRQHAATGKYTTVPVEVWGRHAADARLATRALGSRRFWFLALLFAACGAIFVGVLIFIEVKPWH